MARKHQKHFKRSSPDMGWLVGSTAIEEFFGGSDELRAVQLFDFADIDPEALTGRIEADKSDWYLKRMIIDVYGYAQLPGLVYGDTARMTQQAWGVMGAQDASDISGSAPSIIGPEVYNRWARLFRTETMPVYHAGGLPIATSDGFPEGGLATVPSSDLSHEAAGYFPLFGFWGPSALHIDATISNAGLRNNQGVYWLIGDGQSPGAGFGWQNGDTLYAVCTYRFLLQKRVG